MRSYQNEIQFNFRKMNILNKELKQIFMQFERAKTEIVNEFIERQN
jgi:hypothetical protein